MGINKVYISEVPPIVLRNPGKDGTSGTSGLDGTFFGSSGTSGLDGTYFGSSGTSGIDGTIGPQGERGTDVIVSETPPDISLEAKLWFNSNEGTLYIQYDNGDGIIWIPSNDLVGADGTSGTSGTSADFSGYIILNQVGQSLNFIDDTAAAAGGVPINGLYRNGNIIQIRIV